MDCHAHHNARTIVTYLKMWAVGEADLVPLRNAYFRDRLKTDVGFVEAE